MADLSKPPTGTLLVKDVDVIATMSDSLGDVKQGAIYVKDNVIVWVGKTADLPDGMRTADTILSLPNRVITPGLVCTHHHLFQTMTRGMAPESSLWHWLNTLYPIWDHLTGEDVYCADKVGMAELLMTGCTTVADHQTCWPNDCTLEHCIRAAREMGIRFHPCRGILNLGRSKGGLAPDNCCEDEETALSESKRLIEAFHDNSKYSMLRMALAPSSQKTVTDELMVKVAALARSYPGVRLHTHLAENADDVAYNEKRLGPGARPLDYVKKIGWDQPDCWFAHCVKLEAPELQLFADKGCGIAHCPSSNLRLASGICPVRKAIDMGVKVGIGADGSSSNDSSNMLAETRLACLLQRAGGNPSGMPVREALAVATKGGARVLGRDDIGQIVPGMAADFVGWRVADNLFMAGAVSDPVSALLLCIPGTVDLNVVNGRVLIKDGTFVNGLDVAALVADQNRRATRIAQLAASTATAGDLSGLISSTK